MRCSKCGAVGVNNRTCPIQNGGAQVVVQLYGYMDSVTNVNILHLLDAINALIDTQKGQEYIASRTPQKLFWEVSKGFHIKSPISDDNMPQKREQIWPNEIWAVYYATLLKYIRMPEVLNVDQTMTIQQIYHKIMSAADISALANDYFNQEML